MPVVKIFGWQRYWGTISAEEKIIQAILSIKELELQTSKDITVHFIPEVFSRRDEISVFIEGLFKKSKRTKEIKDLLAKKVGEALEEFFEERKIKVLVECFVVSFNQKIEGFYTNR